MKQLTGRTAIVTGGSAGIGLAVATKLLAQGMNVVISGRSHTRWHAAAGQRAAFGDRAVFVCADVADSTQRQLLVDETLRTFGGIDLLVNNAGVESYCNFHEITAEAIAETIQINLLGALQLTRLVIPPMLAAGRGHVVNMASTAGKHGPAFGAAYGASKAGMISFTQSLRAEYRKQGISASAICPGFTHEGGMYEQMKAETGKHTPWYMGSTTSERVAAATVRAILKDQPEVIVNSPPLRPVFVLAQWLPRMGAGCIRAGSFRFLRRVAQSRSPHPASGSASAERAPQKHAA